MTILQGLPNLFPCPALSWTGSSLMQALCSQLIRLLRPSPRRVFLPGGKWAIRISCVTSGFSQWHRWKAICFYGVWFREGEKKRKNFCIRCRTKTSALPVFLVKLNLWAKVITISIFRSSGDKRSTWLPVFLWPCIIKLVPCLFRNHGQIYLPFPFHFEFFVSLLWSRSYCLNFSRLEKNYFPFVVFFFFPLMWWTRWLKIIYQAEILQ